MILSEEIIKCYLGQPYEHGYLIEKLNNVQQIPTELLQHKLLPITYEVVKKHLPDSCLIPILKKKRLKQVSRMLIRLRELRRLQSKFLAVHVIPRAYKGLVFAHYFYGDISLRSSVDIDLAIGLSDIPKTFDLMKQLGYVELTKDGEISSNHINLAKARAYHIDYSWALYQGKQISCNIEFHWQPAHPVLQVPIAFDALPADAYATVHIKGLTIPTFTKPYLALFTVIHHGLVDTWGQYRHLLDLVLMLKRMTTEEQVLFKQLVAQYNLNNTLNTGLYLIEKLFHLSFVGFTYEKRKYKKLTQELMVALQESNLAGKWSDNTKKLWYHLKMRDTWKERFVTSKQLVWFKMNF